MLPLVNATTFQREFSSGTTKPVLLLCETESGGREEYVTKFRSTVRNSESGLCFECFAAALAQRLGIPTPEAAIVSISPELAQVVSTHSPSAGARMLASAGLNFGSRYLASYATWPTDRIAPANIRQTAIDIIAFDALIENVDRRDTNPNVLALNSDIRAFDHELAFSFVYDFLSDRPWSDRLAFLSQHVFYASVRGRELDLSRFLEALRSLTDSDLEGICEAIPPEFGTSYLGRICDHIRRASSQADAFGMALRTVLR